MADTSKAGDGFPDLVVGYRGRNYLFEVKNPNRPPSRRRLRKSQADFQAAWRGQYTKVETRDDVLRLIGLVDIPEPQHRRVSVKGKDWTEAGRELEEEMGREPAR